MGLLDRLRGGRIDDGGGALGDGGVDPSGAPGDDGVPEPIDFRPRFDGAYRPVGPTDGVGRLTFSRTSVTESGAAGASTGDYTSSGRFVVQRPFGRPVVYTVLAVAPDGFTARRTDTAIPQTTRVEFLFEASSSSA